MSTEMMALVLSAVGLLVTVVLGVFGYFATYYYNLQLTRKQQELDLVNRRINEFYGPLYVSTEMGRIAYEALLRQFGRQETIFYDPDQPPTDWELTEWRLWVERVFTPLNDFRERLILEKAYLIREQEMPACLMDFVTHVSSYKPLLKKWSDGNYISHTPALDFPPELDIYATESYADLKAEQLRLIGALQKKSQ
ncbi:MAG: hypothetical protein U0X20_22175 [Caldilineaceae bacterium]